MNGFEENMLQYWLRNLRLDSQPMAQGSTRDQHGSVTLMDQDLLECPICCEPLKTPIYQCDNGHLACPLCCEKVKHKCPSCKLPIGFSRCRAMEKVVEASRMSCPNAKYGCKESTSYGNRSSHVKKCLFSPCSCPMRDCNYTGSDKDLYIHVRTEHKDDLVMFVWDFTFLIEWDLSKKIAILQEEKDGELIVVQAFMRSHGMVISVSCLASFVPRPGRFSCSLQIATSTIRLKQALILTEIQKVRDEKPYHGFMFIPSYMLPSDGNLKIGICISRGHVHLIHA